jgi:hypothetical protein
VQNDLSQSQLSSSIRDIMQARMGVNQTHLDTRESKEAGLLILQILEDLVGALPIHVRFCHQGEGHAMVEGAELANASVVKRLLPTELNAM